MTDLWQRLKQRKIVQWAVAYVAGAFALLQGIDIIAQQFGWPESVQRGITLALVLGFFVTLLLAWYHGEQGRQRVSGVELLLIALVLGFGGAFLWWAGARPGASGTSHATQSARTAAASSAEPAVLPAAASSIPAKSIAVLPFENLNVDKANAYFVAGMQDLILTKLADIGELKVISRTSTAKYASHPEDLKTIGRQLGVATILEGSVQKAGDRVLINVQLIRAADRSHIWAQSYTRTLKDVFGVEGEVAGKIASALKAKLSPAETARLASNLSHDNAANDLYFKAEYQIRQAGITFSVASVKAAIPLYQQAIAKDPDFALAYARLSYAQSVTGWWGGGGMSVPKLVAAARKNAETALKLAPNLPAAHLALGYSDHYGHGEYATALKEFAAALALRPNDADALAAQGYVERRQGRFEAAIASLQKASTLDPRNSSLPLHLGLTWMMINRYPEAERAFQRALALDPHNLIARTYLSKAIVLASGDIPHALAEVQGDAAALKRQRVFLLTLQRKYREALALLDTVPDTPDNFPAGRSLWQAELHRQMGDPAQARALYAQAMPRVRAWLARQQQKNFNRVDALLDLATAELGLGHTARGLDAIARSLALIRASHNHSEGTGALPGAAMLYAEARRPDLAVPLLARALATPGVGWSYSPVMLWLDPAWDPIRHDQRFQALLRKYAKDKPAVIPAVPASAGGAQ